MRIYLGTDVMAEILVKHKITVYEDENCYYRNWFFSQPVRTLRGFEPILDENGSPLLVNGEKVYRQSSSRTETRPEPSKEWFTEAVDWKEDDERGGRYTHVRLMRTCKNYIEVETATQVFQILDLLNENLDVFCSFDRSTIYNHDWTERSVWRVEED